MSGFKRFFLRPARKPFWENAQGGGLPGTKSLFGGLICLIIAYFITGTKYGPVEVLMGTAGNGSGWQELILLVTAGPFWAVGLISFLIGSVLFLWSFSTWLGTKWAHRVKEEK